MTNSPAQRGQMQWSGWGDPELASPLPGPTLELLRAALGVDTSPRPAVALAEVRLPPSGLTAAARDALAAVVGVEQVLVDDEARVRHTRGKSTPDLLRLRAGDAQDAPDAVVRPASHDEVAAVLAACGDHRLAVVAFGGGTSVVGGLTAARDGLAGAIALDLARLDRLVALDPVSRTATLGAGLLGPEADGLLAPHGLRIGHFPQSYEYASIGGFAATRSSGQASAGYGRFDGLVEAVRMATPAGTLELGRAPASAAGPDLRQLVLGSEGAFGVITEVTVRVHPLPETRVYEGWRFDDFPGGTSAVRALAQDGPLPTVLRLSDEAETAVGLARPTEIGEDNDDVPGGSLLIVGYEGTPTRVAATREAAGAVLADAGGRALGEPPGRAWVEGRFRGPYLRDALLDVGALAETLETASSWSRLPDLYARVQGALTDALTGQETPPLVLCHVSHVYPAGASLYFTVVAAQADDAVEQWRRAKQAAGDAIMAAGATITHHHAVGRDHRPWLADEIGELGVDVLRAVKERLDPDGIMNPGVLVPR